MLYPNLVTLGTCNGGSTVIQADVSAGLGSDVAVAVTLTANYTLANPRPPGFPFHPSFTGAAAVSLEYPRTIPSGTTMKCLRIEAAALVTAGVATYA
jgi:hypothetical protein